MSTTEADVAVGPEEIKRRPGDVHSRELSSVVGIIRDDVGAEQIAQSGMARGHGGLPDEQQGESGIVERLKQVLDRPAGQELEAEPRKAVAGKRRGVGETGKRLGEAGVT